MRHRGAQLRSARNVANPQTLTTEVRAKRRRCHSSIWASLRSI
ncbi:MAG: hypothetical protein ACTS6G_01235 [Candidatus Hodgkinia cicadicola]